METKSRLLRLVSLFFELDIFPFCLAVFLTAGTHQGILQSQTIRPFHTTDASIWHTFDTDTVLTEHIFAIFYFILTPILYFLEHNSLKATKLPPSLRFRLAFRLAFGLWTSSMFACLIVELGKGFVGRLRPSFASRCLGTSIDSHSPPSFITSDAQCISSPALLRDARRSFPSGHAALALACATYAQLLLVRMAIGAGTCAKDLYMVLGWAVFIFGGWISASRISDNAHHVSDVVAGAVIGIWCAVVQFWYINEKTERDLRKEKEQSANSGEQ